MRILLVEDDAVIGDMIGRSLHDAGHIVDRATTLATASHLWRVQPFDAVVLDLNLPDGSGLRALREARARGDRVPVLVLTARNRADERIEGLDAGADDYLGKPFELGELAARLRALERRAHGADGITRVGRLRLDRVAGRFFVDGAEPAAAAASLDLPAREHAVLMTLMTPPGRVVGKPALSDKLSSFDDRLGDNALEVFVSRLRRKIAGHRRDDPHPARPRLPDRARDGRNGGRRPRRRTRAVSPAAAAGAAAVAALADVVAGAAAARRDVVDRNRRRDLPRLGAGRPRRRSRPARQRLRDRRSRLGAARRHARGRPVAEGDRDGAVRPRRATAGVGAHGRRRARRRQRRPARAGRRAERAFYDGSAADGPLRLAVLRSDTPPLFAVVVGQTTRTRSDLLRSLVERALLPQLALLILLGLYLRWQIGRELAPVDRLQRQLGLRRSGELAPIELDARSADVARLRDAVNGLLARIADGVRAQREFAGNVAHDLRTPLAGIRALAEYGPRAARTPAAWREQLQRIVASEERATRLVEQLLALAMADEARDGVRLEPVAVDAVVRRVLLGSMARADAAGVDLGAAGIDAPVLAQASPVLLEGVVANLVDNALRYGRGAAPPEVTVTVDGGRSGAVTIVVADNGPGLDAAQRDALSQRWARGDAGAALGTGSSGLGLSIVSRYVELMAGTLQLESGDGAAGLRVVVTLPAA